ncbi:hypothetical protein L1987_17059 [Smallanthus sonchifolius]|uniref:Uncharacterized protein n=1 Tax=Smallanthus sonchifolius TaxID=185202 RepID=A0ACB9IZB0_9ASTR|nr:hypothetical protein L1987_17059 [Smallanthus sonchifolius]
MILPPLQRSSITTLLHDMPFLTSYTRKTLQQAQAQAHKRTSGYGLVSYAQKSKPNKLLLRRPTHRHRLSDLALSILAVSLRA